MFPSLGISKVLPRRSNSDKETKEQLTNQPNDNDALPQQQNDEVQNVVQPTTTEIQEINTSYLQPFTVKKAFTFFIQGNEVRFYLQGYDLLQECLTITYYYSIELNDDSIYKYYSTNHLF